MLASSDWIVNIGTLVLAAAAIVSAVISIVTLRSSNKVLEAANLQANATQDLAKVAAEDLISSTQPLLTDVPTPRSNTDDNNLFISFKGVENDDVELAIPVRNIGTGPGFIHSAHLVVSETSVPVNAAGIILEPSHRVLTSGESALIRGRVSMSDFGNYSIISNAIMSDGMAKIAVLYNDYTGMLKRMSVFIFGKGLAGRPLVLGVEVHQCNANWEPIGSPVITKTGGVDEAFIPPLHSD